jgi:hypothetical protein
MFDLVQYCNQRSNTPDVRQARMLRVYLLAQLLEVRPDDDVRFYDSNGNCFRTAFYR